MEQNHVRGIDNYDRKGWNHYEIKKERMLSMSFPYRIEPIVERFEDPYYPVRVCIGEHEGEVIYYHDRKNGQYLVGEDDSSFRDVISHIRAKNKSVWSKLTADIVKAVFDAKRS